MWKQPEEILDLLSSIIPAPSMHCWVLIRDDNDYTYRLLHRNSFDQLYDQKIEWNQPSTITKSNSNILYGFAAVDYTYYIHPFTKYFESQAEHSYVRDLDYYDEHICFFSKHDWLKLYDQDNSMSLNQVMIDTTIRPELIQIIQSGGKISDIVQLLDIYYPPNNLSIWCAVIGSDYELKSIYHVFEEWIELESIKITSESTAEGEIYYKYTFSAYQSLDDSDPSMTRSARLFPDRGYVDDFNDITGLVTRYFSAQAWINKFGSNDYLI
jgi:hypothetical protein